MKKFLSVVILILIVALGFFTTYRYFEELNKERLNFVHSFVSDRIAEKFQIVIDQTPKYKHAIIEYETLLNELNFIERNFAERIFSLDPNELGFKGPFYSKESPEDLIMIDSKTFIVDGKEIETGIQFCPSHSYEDYTAMNEQMNKDIGKVLYVDSGYRSPGRQAYLFFKYLVSSNEYSLKENAKWIAMPGYSEHGHPINNALDFINEAGINGMNKGQTAEDFAELPEYKWLLKNADKFNFYLTYSRNNNLGVNFEPWHWHWEK